MSTTLTQPRTCELKHCRCNEIEFSSHCPLCHKFMGNDVFHSVLNSGDVVCVHCYRLEQLANIESLLDEMPVWMQKIRDGWAEAKSLMRCWRPSYRRARRRMFIMLGELMAESATLAT